MTRTSTTLAMGLAAFVSACEPVEQPFRVGWQFCLTPQHGAASADDWLRDVAAEGEMEFWDRSDGAQWELDQLLKPDDQLRQSFPVFFKGANGEELRLTLSNLGVGSDQLILTVSSYSREALDSQSPAFGEQLSEKWDVERFPADVGAVPLDCE